MKIPPEAPSRFEARVLPSSGDVAEAAAREFESAAREAIDQRGVFRVALSGGSTPRALHETLARAPFRRTIEWKRVLFFFGDERCVSPNSSRSNYRMAKETLFEPLAIAAARVFRMRGEAPPKTAARQYGQILAEQFADEHGTARFDLVFLGLGPDGHTASLFPGTSATSERNRAVAANWVPKFREWRLTLTYPVLNAARRAVFLVAGPEKADVATAILRKTRGSSRFPAANIRPRRGALLWLLDEEAGGRL